MAVLNNLKYVQCVVKPCVHVCCVTWEAEVKFFISMKILSRQGQGQGWRGQLGKWACSSVNTCAAYF